MVSNLLFAFVLAMGTQGFEPNLTDQACGITDVRLAPAPGAEISGHCDDVDSARMLQVSLTTEDPRFRGAVKQMSLGFCGEIVRAGAPTGWTATMRRSSAAFGRPAEVAWNVVAGPVVPDEAVLSSRIDGFSVVLKPGWRRAIAFGISWQHTGARSGSPHDCGEWPK
jgi:hypothetical protein